MLLHGSYNESIVTRLCSIFYSWYSFIPSMGNKPHLFLQMCKFNVGHWLGAISMKATGGRIRVPESWLAMSLWPVPLSGSLYISCFSVFIFVSPCVFLFHFMLRLFTFYSSLFISASLTPYPACPHHGTKAYFYLLYVLDCFLAFSSQRYKWSTLHFSPLAFPSFVKPSFVWALLIWSFTVDEDHQFLQWKKEGTHHPIMTQIKHHTNKRSFNC